MGRVKSCRNRTGVPKDRLEQMEMLRLLSDPASTPFALQATARYFRKLLATAVEPMPLHLDILPSLVSTLIACLDDIRYPELQLDAAWSLTNICCGGEWETHQVVEAGACPSFLRLAEENVGTELGDQALWALSNIAGDCSNCRNGLLDSGFLPLLVSLLKDENLETVRAASLKVRVWALSNICRTPSDRVDFEELRPCVPMLARILLTEENQGEELLADVAWTMAYLAEAGSAQINAVLESGVAPRLVSFLSHPSHPLMSGALRAIGNTIAGNDQQTQTVLDAGAIAPLQQLLRHEKESTRREALWALSNVTAGTAAQIHSVLQEPDILDDVMEIFATGSPKLQREAAWAICNAATGGSNEDVEFLISYGFVSGMCELLMQHEEAHFLATLLAGIQSLLNHCPKPLLSALLNVMAECGGMNAVAGLRQHRDLPLRLRAEDLWNEHFLDFVPAPVGQTKLFRFRQPA